MLVSGCKSKTETQEQAGTSQDTRFDTFKNNLLLKFWRLIPE